MGALLFAAGLRTDVGGMRRVVNALPFAWCGGFSLTKVISEVSFPSNLQGKSVQQAFIQQCGAVLLVLASLVDSCTNATSDLLSLGRSTLMPMSLIRNSTMALGELFKYTSSLKRP